MSKQMYHKTEHKTKAIKVTTVQSSFFFSRRLTNKQKKKKNQV